MNRLNKNLIEKIKEKYREKIKEKIKKKYFVSFYMIEICESNILFYKNNNKSHIDYYSEELRDFLEIIFKKKINNMMEYKKERNKIFRNKFIEILLNNLNINELEEFYEIVKDKKIYY